MDTQTHRLGSRPGSSTWHLGSGSSLSRSDSGPKAVKGAKNTRGKGHKDLKRWDRAGEQHGTVCPLSVNGWGLP